MKSDPEVCSQRTRRAFTAVQREAILAEHDACENAADRAAAIRKHAIYSSHMENWRKQLTNVDPPKKRGCRANPLTTELHNDEATPMNSVRRVSSVRLCKKLAPGTFNYHGLRELRSRLNSVRRLRALTWISASGGRSGAFVSVPVDDPESIGRLS